MLGAILAGALAGAAAWHAQTFADADGHSIPFILPEGQAFHRCWPWSLDGDVAGRRSDGLRGHAWPQLYLRSMSQLDVKAIAGTDLYEACSEPVFSPDGRSIAFFARADQTLKRIAVTGGAAVTICAADAPVRHELGPRRHRLRPGQQRHHAGLPGWRHTGGAREREGR